MKTNWLCAAIMLLLAWGGNAMAQESLNMEHVASIPFDWDNAYDIRVQGRFAYIADGLAGLRIVDVSDPTHPTQTGVFHTPGIAAEVEIVQDVVFLGGSTIGGNNVGGYFRIDVSDPTSPRALAGLDTFSNLTDILRDDRGILYISKRHDNEYSGWLRIFDVTFPAEPVVLKEMRNESVPIELAYQNEMLICRSNNGVTVFDVSEVRNMDLLVSKSINQDPNSKNNMLFEGNTLYISTRDSIVVFEIGHEVVQIGAAALEAYANTKCNFKIFDRLYLWSDWVLTIYDVTDLANIMAVKWLYPSITPVAASLSDGVAYLAASEDGLSIYNFAELDTAYEIGNYVDPKNVYSVDIIDRTAFVTSSIGLHSIDISDPQHPRKIGFVSARGEIAQSHGLLYVGGLSVVDPTDPTDLELLGRVSVGASCQAIRGNLMAVTGWDTISFVDLRVPERPMVIGSIKNAYGNRVTWAGQYLVKSNGLLELFDVSNLNEAISLCRYGNQWSIYAIAAKDTLVYAGLTDLQADGSNRYALQMLSVGDPNRFRDLGIVDLPWHVDEIRLEDDRALLSCGDSGVVILSLEDPISPRIIGYTDTPGKANEVVSRNGYVFVADASGFEVYDCSNILNAPEPLPEIVSSFSLHAPYPNPFNSTTTIRYSVPSTASAELMIFDPLGRKIADLTPELARVGGQGAVTWQADGISSGVYIARLTTEEGSVERQIVLTK